jgi:hypothetical protein
MRTRHNWAGQRQQETLEKLKAFKSASAPLLQGGAPADDGGEDESKDKKDKKSKKEKKDKKEKKEKKDKKAKRGGADGADVDMEVEEQDKYKSGQKKSGNTEVSNVLLV